MLIAIVPVIVLLLGLALHFVSNNPKVQVLGVPVIAIGLFFVVFALTNHTVRLL